MKIICVIWLPVRIICYAIIEVLAVIMLLFMLIGWGDFKQVVEWWKQR